MVRKCWVNFQCRGVLLIWIRVGQGPTALAVGASGGCLDIFTLIYPFSPLSPSLRETARYRLKYCLKGPFNPKQPTIQSNAHTQHTSLLRKIEKIISPYDKYSLARTTPVSNIISWAKVFKPSKFYCTYRYLFGKGMFI